MTIRALIRFFSLYKYEAIFPIAVLEGPIITIISGFLVSRHILSFLPAFLVVFFGDAISDTIFYWIGHHGRNFIQKLKFLRVTDERINKIEAQYARSPWKTMIVAKVSYGLGTVFMLSAGLSRMSLGRFFHRLLFWSRRFASRSGIFGKLHDRRYSGCSAYLSFGQDDKKKKGCRSGDFVIQDVLQ